MPLRVPNPPAESINELQRYLPRLNRATKGLVPESFSQPIGDNAPPGPARLPHRLFTLGLNVIASGGGLAAAKETAWRYLVDEGPKVVAAEVQIVEGGHRFGQLNEGPFVAQIPDAVRRFETDPRVAQRDYELRAVIVPALYVFALWLHAPQSAELLMPLPPTHRLLEPNRIYEEPAFMEALGRAAQERLKFGDAPTQG